jgi:hypothetical protein
MTNPSNSWDRVPVWGIWATPRDTPIGGEVDFTIRGRLTRVDGRVIYPGDYTETIKIGETSQQDAEVRSMVRAQLRALDEAEMGEEFDGTAWDVLWDSMLPGAVFTRYPATDDPDIVQTDFRVEVRERLAGGATGKTYVIEPTLVSLPLGINLNRVEVPPGSPGAPPPVYAKGVPGGVASLDADGLVPVDQLPPFSGGGAGTELTSYTGQVEALPDYPAAFPPAGHTHTSEQISDATAFGRSLLALADAPAGRSALSAAAATHGHTAAQISDFAESVDDRVAALLQGSSGVTLSYNDAANTLTITGGGSGGLDAEAVRDAIGVALLGTGLITVTVNDAADTITISTTATANSTDAQLRDRSTHTGSQDVTTVTGALRAQGSAVGVWMGTQAEYDALATKPGAGYLVAISG